MSEKDDFWDIASLLPPKQKSFLRNRADASETTGRLVKGQPQSSPFCVKEGVFREKRDKEIFYEYTPRWNPLLHRLRIYREESSYKLYHLFRNDAIKSLDKGADECSYVPCYSYIPQHSQLNASQKAYYLYFRREANNGNYIKTNQSYFLLYIYEIINLPDYIPPKIGAERMAKAWLAYRKQLPAIDKYMTAWLSDYCLLHNTPCPKEVLQPVLNEILPLSSLKEFYLGNGDCLSVCQTEAFFALSSDYQYQNGRYAKGEYSHLFLEHIGESTKIVLNKILDNEVRANSFQTVAKQYPAYIGALCAQPYRYTIEVSYCSVSGTEALRALVTAVVKYAENKVRAALSIKSRLSVCGLLPAYRALIDSYFSERFPPVKKSDKSDAVLPAYEKMYDAVSFGFSSDEAQSIEESSWKNTRLLISEEEASEVFSSHKDACEEEVVSEKVLTLSRIDVQMLSVFLNNGVHSARVFAKNSGVLFEGAVERINEYFTDMIGDIVIAIDVDPPCLIKDYESEVLAFLALNKDDGEQ